jgi:hypothetical protein
MFFKVPPIQDAFPQSETKESLLKASGINIERLMPF